MVSIKNRKKIVALIPARSGSVRIKNKNILKIRNHPLLAYSIRSAINSKLFSSVVVSTDSKKYKKIAQHYGAEVPFLRPKKISLSNSSDYEWVKFTLENLKDKFEAFFILRPTNPFRNSKTILRAWKLFQKHNCKFSVRGVCLTRNHPAKMWYKSGSFIKPVMKGKYKNQPFYNSQFTVLPKIFLQNASIEISQCSVIRKNKTITTKKIIPFIMKDEEGHDINYLEDVKNLSKKKLKYLEKIKV